MLAVMIDDGNQEVNKGNFNSITVLVGYNNAVRSYQRTFLLENFYCVGRFRAKIMASKICNMIFSIVSK
jgi:hypothetical protein